MTIKALTSAALAIVSMSNGLAHAISQDVTVDFSNLGYSIAGKANLQPVVSATVTNGTCPTVPGAYCYYEDGMAVGVVYDSSPYGGGAHVHPFVGAQGNRAVSYHNDSSGIYIRAKDSSAFSLTSMDFNASIGFANPGTGADDYWEIIGFNTALNPTADVDAAPSGSLAAFQTVANGFNGTLSLNNDFGNIGAFWIHYHGWPRVPYDLDAVYDENGDLVSDGPYQVTPFAMVLDNVRVGAPVPLPSAAWLLLAGVMGLLGINRRKVSV